MEHASSQHTSPTDATVPFEPLMRAHSDGAITSAARAVSVADGSAPQDGLDGAKKRMKENGVGADVGAATTKKNERQKL